MRKYVAYSLPLTAKDGWRSRDYKSHRGAIMAARRHGPGRYDICTYELVNGPYGPLRPSPLDLPPRNERNFRGKAMSKHTSGPWEPIRQLGRITAIGRNGNGIICEAPYDSSDAAKNFQANAPVIMSAPLGLELAKMVLKYANLDSTRPLFAEMEAKAREVLAVAKGEKP